MNMKNLSVRRLVRCAVIAAVYVVVCLVLAPFSYGAVQVRAILVRNTAARSFTSSLKSILPSAVK